MLKFSTERIRDSTYSKSMMFMFGIPDDERRTINYEIGGGL